MNYFSFCIVGTMFLFCFKNSFFIVLYRLAIYWFKDVPPLSPHIISNKKPVVTLILIFCMYMAAPPLAAFRILSLASINFVFISPLYLLWGFYYTYIWLLQVFWQSVEALFIFLSNFLFFSCFILDSFYCLSAINPIWCDFHHIHYNLHLHEPLLVSYLYLLCL